MTTLDALLQLTSSASRHGGRIGPTTGAVAFCSGLTYAETQRDLRTMRDRGEVTEYRDRGEVFPRYLPTAETAAKEGQP
jgi:hypothetical protein